mmetsp:Transcript_36942/g.77170  ORF Transcript_36942/g.77170 Transcript_36942/m.77170 type:complete len:245 (+) Transcript_36942:268-1002(+)
MPVHTTNGTLWWRAARATVCMPVVDMTPPLASTAEQPTMTLLTRAMMAKMAASVMTVVEMPALARRRAMLCPSRSGAFSDTTTSNLRPREATSRRKYSTVLDMPHVRITSLAWMCSMAWSAICSLMLSISSTSSLICRHTVCLKLLGTVSVHESVAPLSSLPAALPRSCASMFASDGTVRRSMDWPPCSSSSWCGPSSLLPCDKVAYSSRTINKILLTMFPTTSSEGDAAISFLPMARISSSIF